MAQHTEGHPVPVTKVRTVYGDMFYVATDHLADARRVMLPIYTRGGIRWADTRRGEAAVRRGEATMLHRENIAAEVKKEGA